MTARLPSVCARESKRTRLRGDTALHEDDGETFGFRDGASYRTELLLRRTGGEIALDAATTGRGYPEFARREFVVTLHGLPPVAATIGGRAATVRNGRLTFENAGANFPLRATM